MSAYTRWTTGIATACLIVLGSCVVAVRACRSETRTVLLTAASPTGLRRAYLLQLDTNANATVGFYYEVVTLPLEERLDLKAPPEPIWTAYEIEPRQIQWVNEKSVEVVVPADAGHNDTITRRLVDGVTSVTKYAPMRNPGQ